MSIGDNDILAEIVRHNLKQAHLDIPGTVYFDENLNHLHGYYSAVPAKRAYYILLDDNTIIGGIGLAEFAGIDNCAELQKLYLVDAAKGHGLGYFLVKLIETCAHKLGYSKIYLETHTNLPTAIHIYEKLGFQEISPPPSVCHATMNKFYIKTPNDYRIKIPSDNEILSCVTAD